jgi:ATP-dependent Clp protease protease subunit
LNKLSNPLIITKSQSGEKAYDLHSLLFKERKIMINSDIDEDVSQSIVSQLLHLDEEDSNEEIILFINSPGGSVTDGLAIYDTIQFIDAPVTTVCVGLAASMAQVLLCAGEPGRRFSFPNSRIMMHQPSGGTWGQGSDIEIYHNEMVKIKDLLYGIIQKHTGKSYEEIKKHADRDYWMSPKEAKKYNLIDKIIKSKKDLFS